MFQQKKPYSAVTVAVENLTGERYEEDDLSGIIELVESIKLQATGPTEAARALRKKLKYGNAHRQIRALVILDGLIENAGPRFQRTFADEPLLERLRVCGSSDLSDPDVKAKCRQLFASWAQHAKTPGLEKIARLHKEMPKRKQVVTQERSRVIRETEENPFEDDEEEEQKSAPAAQPRMSSPSQSSSHAKKNSYSSGASTRGPYLDAYMAKPSKSKDKSKSKSKGSRKVFNLEAEKEQMKSSIAESSIASINLMNALQSINREQERISENAMAVDRFETCKQLRRRILRYIHHVESEQWLGGLLHANDELVHALMSYEQLDSSIDADSDSDDELAEQAHMYRMATMKGKEAMGIRDSEETASPSAPDLSGLNIGNEAPSRPPPLSAPKPPAPTPPQPPRPARAAEPETPLDEDDNDPFADSNVVETPAIEKGPIQF